MPANPNREFNLEITGLVNKRVNVSLSNNKTYTGVFRGIQDSYLSFIVLAEASCDDEYYFRVFLNGTNVIEITLADEPFDLSGLASELSQMFQPQNVKILEEAAIIQVFDRFTVSEEGVKGSGPISERIQKIYDKYTGYPSGRKEMSYSELFKRDPAKILQIAVKGMLPKSRLAKDMYRSLKVYADEEHRHASQNLRKIEV